ncbi:MAG: alpha/beta hydrolase fold domain-containing protein [Pirellulales bacterium]|nr:alpha/beta hydrolase fold domain-containing protein [Pirellulales bacterium]
MRQFTFRVAGLAILTLLAPLGVVEAQSPAEEIKEIIKKYDADSNGRLDPAERQKIRKDVSEGELKLSPTLRRQLQQAAQRRAGQNRAVMGRVEVQRDVEYGRAGDRALKLDLVRPKKTSDKPRPAIVFIHGGGWQGGNKSGGVGRLTPLVAGGDYVGASVGYRLSGEAIWPAQIHDCKAAIRYLKANADKLGIDPNRIGVWGTSAGGHLVDMLGTTGDVAALEGDNGSAGQSSRVACVVSFFGPTDLRGLGGGGHARGPVTKLLGGPVSEHPEAAASASPITHVTKDDCPFLLVHGTDDPLVPLAQSETFHKALRAAGVDSTLLTVQGGGHGFNSPKVSQRVADFFAKHLQGKDVSLADETIQVTPHKRPKP